MGMSAYWGEPGCWPLGLALSLWGSCFLKRCSRRSECVSSNFAMCHLKFYNTGKHDYNLYM